MKSARVSTLDQSGYEKRVTRRNTKKLRGKICDFYMIGLVTTKRKGT